MEDRESDLLFGLLALQLGFVNRDQLLECVAVWTGVAGRSLEDMLRAKAALRDDQARAVKGMVEARVARSGVDRTRVAAPPAVSKATDVAPSVRYRLMGEIGRGGLGRVVEAHDSSLDRTVALKLALDDLPSDLAERFVREARLAARLEHPSIIPVYDLGSVAGADGTARAFLAMKRVKGRDLSQVLGLLAAATPEARREWTRGRLLRVFQDVCLAMAFAHDRGVIHRDLKPSNVMIGDYGETMVVDWGLARETGKGGREAGTKTTGASSPALTLDGDILGTPAYMSPEQATGRMDSVDARSDIYSLGAILYEILTLRPPAEGSSIDEVLEIVRSGRLVSPTERLRAARAARNADVKRSAGASSTDAAGSRIPPELEAVCMKALALRPDDRFQDARALHDEVQLFVEGVKQREREMELASMEVARAREAADRHRRLVRESKSARQEAMKIGKRVKPHEDKAELWATEDRAARQEAEAVESFAEAERALTLALGHVKDHADARRIKAELYWERFLEAESAGNAAESRLARRVAEQFNDGDLDARLKGDGTLAVKTRQYPCRCLLDGREVLPEELNWRGFHPYSGRALDGHAGAEGVPVLEPKGPVSLRVHGPGCRTAPVAGADVWLWKFEEEGRLLVPVTPEGASGPDGSSAAARVFETASPFRPRGPGRFLGKTPVAPVALPMGSWLLVVAREGFEAMRVPVQVDRCQDVAVDVTLFRAGEIPEGFVAVPAGAFTYQGDRTLSYSTPAETIVTDDLFVARHPVTCRGHAAFLNAIEPAEAARRVPRELAESGAYWPGPPYAVPTTAWLATATPELRAKARRIANVPFDWDENWPALGASWEDAVAFCAWTSSTTRWLTTLLHEIEWEKTARGPDRRPFTMGNHMDGRWANNNRSFPDGPRPVPVAAFPHDESPYGVRGLTGNSHDHCLNDPGPEMPGWRLFRGGFWSHSGENSRTTARSGYPPRSVAPVNGIRAARLVRVGAR